LVADENSPGQLNREEFTKHSFYDKKLQIALLFVQTIEQAGPSFPDGLHFARCHVSVYCALQ